MNNYEIEGEDPDLFGDSEDIGAYYGEDIGAYYGEDINDDDVGEDDYREEPEAAESRRSRYPYYRQARARAARARALRAARARAAWAARARGPGYPRTFRPRPLHRADYFPPPAGRPADTAQVREGFTRVRDDVQQTKAALQNVDLENKVQSDMVARTLATQGKRITGNEYALAASKVVDEFKTQFPDLVSNDIIKTALPLAPLLFLQPQKRGGGFLSVATDPRVWGLGLAAALAVVSKVRDRDREPQEVTVTPGAFTLALNATVRPIAVARDGNGRIISGLSFRWESSDPRVATVDATTGLVTAVATGSTVITAIETTKNVPGVAIVTVT